MPTPAPALARRRRPAPLRHRVIERLRLSAPAPGARPGFWRGTRGAAAVEGAVAVFFLVSAFAGLMGIVTNVWTEDELGRAARAAARAIALDPGADPWGPVWEEIDRSKDPTLCTTDWTAADHGTCGGLTLAVVKGVSPAALAASLDGTTLPAASPAGELVVVGLSRPSGTVAVVPNANSNASPTVAELVGSDAAIGVARSEPEV